MGPGHDEPPRTLAVLVLVLALMLVLLALVLVARELDRLDRLPLSKGGGPGHAHAAESRA